MRRFQIRDDARFHLIPVISSPRGASAVYAVEILPTGRTNPEIDIPDAAQNAIVMSIKQPVSPNIEMER